MKNPFKEALKIQAVDFQRKNIPLPEYLQTLWDEMSLEEKYEIEIKLIEADYKLEEVNNEKS